MTGIEALTEIYMKVKHDFDETKQRLVRNADMVKEMLKLLQGVSSCYEEGRDGMDCGVIFTPCIALPLPVEMLKSLELEVMASRINDVDKRGSHALYWVYDQGVLSLTFADVIDAHLDEGLDANQWEVRDMPDFFLRMYAPSIEYALDKLAEGAAELLKEQFGSVAYTTTDECKDMDELKGYSLIPIADVLKDIEKGEQE